MNFIKKLVKMAKGKSREPEPPPRPYKHLCGSCNKPIYEGERWSKQGGIYLHKTCYKALKQMY